MLLQDDCTNRTGPHAVCVNVSVCACVCINVCVSSVPVEYETECCSLHCEHNSGSDVYVYCYKTFSSEKEIQYVSYVI